MVIAYYFIDGLGDFSLSTNDWWDYIYVYSIEVFGTERCFFISFRLGNILINLFYQDNCCYYNSILNYTAQYNTNRIVPKFNHIYYFKI